MTALYILLGIVLFIIALLSIRITVSGEFFDSFKLNVSWLFLKFQIFPIKKKEKTKKKKEKEKKTEPQKEKTVEETAEKKDNIFLRFYNNQGFDGVIQLINGAAFSLQKMLSSLKKHLVLRELYLWMTVSENHDAAETAVKYGKVCQKVFPAMSYICSVMTVKKYDVNIEPDYLGSKNKAEFVFTLSVRPIFFINAIIVFAFRLLFKVVIKFLKGAKDKSENNKNINEGGAL